MPAVLFKMAGQRSIILTPFHFDTWEPSRREWVQAVDAALCRHGYEGAVSFPDVKRSEFDGLLSELAGFLEAGKAIVSHPRAASLFVTRLGAAQAEAGPSRGDA